MIFRSVCAVAFYCRRCGSVHIHDVPYFNGSSKLVLRCEACGSEQVAISYKSARWLEFSVECIGCGTENKFSFSHRELRRMQLEKIYCHAEHFELGYIGQRKRIKELLAFNQAEFDALHPQDGSYFLEKQQIILEALGRLQEMAELGAINCDCGGQEIQAGVEGSSIIVECCRCGSVRTLKAEKLEDLSGLGYGCSLTLEMVNGAKKKKAEKIS